MTLKQVPLQLITTEDEQFMGYTLDVTREHIQMGEKGNANMCPISLAVKDFFKAHGTQVDVSNNSFGIFVGCPNGEQGYYDISGSDENPYSWGSGFDEGEDVEPIRIAFNPQEMTARIIEIEEIH